MMFKLGLKLATNILEMMALVLIGILLISVAFLGNEPVPTLLWAIVLLIMVKK